MKLINKLFIICAVWMLAACNATDLDLQDNPNSVTPENAEVQFLYNNIQLNFRDHFNNMYFFTATHVRQITAVSGDTYINAYSPGSMNGIWFNTYAELLPDIDALLALTDDRGLDVHGGSARIMKAYTLMTMVDLFGDIPYSEALKGTDPISPARDKGQDVYNAALGLLDDAINKLKGTTAAKPANDIFYKGDPNKWITLANTLKLRAALNLADANTINTLISGGDLIDQASEDFQFQYGSNRDNPNSRHPFYNDSYETDDGQYQSNYFMWLLHGEKDIDDPRLRYYFYRQDRDLSDQIADQTLWSCVWSVRPDNNAKPQHYLDIDPNLPYCIASEDGYVGRDHLNGEGIPPDGPFRTVYGLYPGGGRFDDNSAKFTQNAGIDGALGQGINPIMLSSFTDFMRAEASQTLGTTGDARALLKSAIEKSLTKVQTFETYYNCGAVVIGTNPDGSPKYACDLLMTTASKTAYVDYVLARYDAAPTPDAKLDVIIKEYMIALFGNGIEAYNAFRRTGKPLKIQPTIVPNPGPFNRSAIYPSDHVTLNANAPQKASGSERVFWDKGPDVY
jgi:hypothetical protein